jgi:hypothetical protein
MAGSTESSPIRVGNRGYGFNLLNTFSLSVEHPLHLKPAGWGGKRVKRRSVILVPHRPHSRTTAQQCKYHSALFPDSAQLVSRRTPWNGHPAGGHG